MKKKTQFNFRVDADAYNEFCKVAEAEHMEPQRFLALLVGKFGDLKQGHGLSALTAIPKDFFKARPGRIPNSAHDTLISPPAKLPLEFVPSIP